MAAKVKKDKGGYYIQFRYQGNRPYITTYKGQISFRQNYDLAVRSASVINSELERGIFRKERWQVRSKKLFNVQGYSEEWLKVIPSSISLATLHDYKNSFHNHINPILGDEYIEDINLEKLTLLMNNIKREPKGKKNVMGAMHRLMKYAHQNGHIPAMPLFPEFRGKNQIIKPEIRWVEPNEQFKILENIPKIHRPIFTFISLTGCRPSEARAFQRENIRERHIIFTITFGRGEEIKEVKGKKIMPFPLTEALKELFALTPTNLTSFVFINQNTGRTYSRNFNKIFNRAKKLAGFPNLKLNEFGRKSFAMQTLAHMEKGMVSHLLRHQDPRMIDHYAEYQTAPLKSALDKIQQIASRDTATRYS